MGFLEELSRNRRSPTAEWVEVQGAPWVFLRRIPISLETRKQQSAIFPPYRASRESRHNLPLEHFVCLTPSVSLTEIAHRVLVPPAIHTYVMSLALRVLFFSSCISFCLSDPSTTFREIIPLWWVKKKKGMLMSAQLFYSTQTCFPYTSSED